MTDLSKKLETVKCSIIKESWIQQRRQKSLLGFLMEFKSVDLLKCLSLFTPHKKVLGFGLMSEHLSSKAKACSQSSAPGKGGAGVSRCISWPICGEPTPVYKGVGRREHVCRGRGDSTKANQATVRRCRLWIQHPRRPHSWLLEFLYLTTSKIESYFETKNFFKQKRKKGKGSQYFYE